MASFHGLNSVKEILVIKECSLGTVRLRQMGVPVDISFTNNAVDNNSLIQLPEVNRATCIIYAQNYIVPSQL